MSAHFEELPIRITCFGMDEYAQKIVENVFQQRANSRFILVEETAAEAGMVDLDGFGAQGRWHKYRQSHPSLPTLIFSIRAQQLPDSLFVQKPLDITDLLAALEIIREKVLVNRHQLGGLRAKLEHLEHDTLQAKSSNLKAPNAQAKPKLVYYDAGFEEEDHCKSNKTLKAIDNRHVFYHPAEYLQGILAEAIHTACQRKINIRLEGLREILIIAPKEHRVYYSATQQQLRDMALIPIQIQQTRMIEVSDQELENLFHATTTPIRYQFDERLLWKVAIWCANGRVPHNTCLETPVIVKYWPNFTRLLLTPHAIQIIALWRKQPFSLTQTANMLKLHPCYIFTVFSAANALDIAVIDRRHTARLEPPPADVVTTNTQAQVSVHSKRSLFQRILAHLRKLKDNE